MTLYAFSSQYCSRNGTEMQVSADDLSAPCVPCLPGQYNGNTTLGGSCVACPVSSYCPKSGLSSPIPCPLNSFANETGLQSCFKCRTCNGTISYAPYPRVNCTATADVVCSICDTGAFYNASLASCDACQVCEPGSFAVSQCSPLSDAACEPCIAGSNFTSSRDLSTCSTCSMGCAPGSYFVSPCTPSSDLGCAICEAGFYCAGGLSNKTRCDSDKYCPPGSSSQRSPGMVAALSPSWIAVPPTATAPITFNASFSFGVELVQVLSVGGIPCRTSILMGGGGSGGIIMCTLDMAAASAASATSPVDEVDLSVSYTFSDIPVLFNSTPLPESKLVFRPTLSTISPQAVTGNSAIFLIGSNFCVASFLACSSLDTSAARAWVGALACASLEIFTPGAAICYVPSPSLDEAGYPLYNVTVQNAWGAISRPSKAIRAGGLGANVVTYPAGGSVRNATVFPTTFVPCDSSNAWPQESDLSVNVFALRAAEPFMGAFSCSLSTSTALTLLILPPQMTTFTNLSAASGVVNFGRISIQSLYSTDPTKPTAVDLSVSCTSSTIAQALADYRFRMTSLPFYIQACALPANVTSSFSRLPPWSLALRLPGFDSCAAAKANGTGGGWQGPPIPTGVMVTCSMTSNEGSGLTIQGGGAIVDPASGVANFTETVLAGTTNANHSVSLRCSLGGVSLYPAILYSIYISSCGPGLEPSGVVCAACKSGTYSDGGGQRCIPCPAVGVSCADGVLTPLLNYYRPPEDAGLPLDASSELFSCTLPYGCFVRPWSSEGRGDTNASAALSASHPAWMYGCNPGYMGPLCGTCAEGFTLSSSSCVPCFDKKSSIAIVMVAVFCAVLAVSYYVLSPTSLATKETLAGPIALRIFLTHMQMLTTLRAMRQSGTLLYRDFFSWTDVVGAAAITRGPAACSIQPSFEDAYLLILLMPALAIGTAIAIIFVSTAYMELKAAFNATCLRRTTASFREKLMKGRHASIMVFVAQIAYMPVISSSIKVFSCTAPIHGVRYLTEDLRVRCDEGRYYAIATIAGLTLIFFGVGYPIWLARKFAAASAELLKDRRFSEVWGYLYNGYKTDRKLAKASSSTAALASTAVASALESLSELPAPPPTKKALEEVQKQPSPSPPPHRASLGKYLHRTFFATLVWWESTVMLRKAGLVLLSNLVTSSIAQIICVGLWILLFLILHIRFLPYRESTFNWTEGASLITVEVTAILCAAVSSSLDESYLASSVTIIMILANMACFLLLAYSFFRFGILPHLQAAKRVRMPTITTAAAFCCNKRQHKKLLSVSEPEAAQADSPRSTNSRSACEETSREAPPPRKATASQKRSSVIRQMLHPKAVGGGSSDDASSSSSLSSSLGVVEMTIINPVAKGNSEVYRP